MKTKEFKTLDEQVEILRGKGLVVTNPEYAKEVLLRENYFFLNGYRYLFYRSWNDKRFIEGTTFEELYSLFLFDREFRNIMFKYLSVIENNVKSIIAYQLSLKYGYKEKDYLNKHTFTNEKSKARQVNDLVRKMQRQIRVNTRQHSATSHYINNYGYIPLWVLVKVLSFGIVAETFTILKNDDQDAIANIYNMDSDDFALYISLLSNYRNICAHEDIIFDNKTQRVITDNIYHKELDIPKTDGEYVYGKNDLFAVVIMLKQLLSPQELTNLVIELKRAIDNLAYNLKVIPIEKVLDRMGFPTNWEKISEIEKKVLRNA